MYKGQFLPEGDGVVVKAFVRMVVGHGSNPGTAVKSTSSDQNGAFARGLGSSAAEGGWCSC